MKCKINHLSFSLIVFALCLFQSGCVGTVKPSLVHLANHDMTTILSEEPIAIINAQDIKEVSLPYETMNGPILMNANLNDWNLQVIELMKEWFDKNGISIVDAAKKKIYVSITNPEIRGSQSNAHPYRSI